MDVNIRELAKSYSKKSTDELVGIYLDGALTEEAFNCLIGELGSRGVDHYQLYLKSDLSQLKAKKSALLG
ncbi:hypothetical protein [Kangiella taiwanensis]|uniref:Uncharacterized protein n=1 Tax=Kangiella taiwanensis TaxID=1079179 RepID=A0ABP8I6N1_9GAMM|nr:hypothetical protein [Kangiella taiwanensis]